MRRLHFAWMVVFVLAAGVIGCGGGGGGSTADPIDTQTFSPNLTVGASGNSLTLEDGAVITVPSGAVTGSTAVEFKKTEQPPSLGEEAFVYTYSSDREIRQASFTLPVGLSDIDDKEDLDLIYVRSEDRAYATVDFQFDAAAQTVTFTIDDNWTFANIPKTIKASNQGYAEVQSEGSSFISTIIGIKKGLVDVEFFPKSKDPMPMPFYTQMGETCWATTGKMVEKSLYPMGQDPGNQIYDFMELLDVTYEEGLTPNKYPSYARLISGHSGK